MIISKKNRREICKYLFQEGVLYAKKDYNLAKHPKVEVPNLEVIKLMQSFKSKEYVRETFSWQHYYWYLTNDGIEHLRTYLNLPSEIVPNTLKKSAKPPSRPFGSGPPGDRPRGPPRFDGDRPRFGDRDGYRGGPRGAPGDFSGEKGGAPAEFQPSFRGSRPGFGRGGGGAFGGGASSMDRAARGTRPLDSSYPRHGGGSGARRRAARAGPSAQRRLYLRRRQGVSVRGVRGAAVEIPVPRLLPPHLQPSLRPVPQAPHRLHRQAPPRRPRPALPIRRQPAPLRLQLFGGDEAGQGVGSQADRRLRPQLRRSRTGPAAKVAVFPPQGAHRRGIRLYFLPRGMTRREQNRSRHNYRKDCIYWTLEWRFNSTDVVLTDHEIDEHTNLLSLLEKHLSPSPWKDQLTPYRNTELRYLKLFIQKSAKESESPYRQLNIEEPLGPQLRSIIIVEYPTINVFLPSDSCDFEVEKMVNKLSRNELPLGSSNDSPLLEGTEFHEEEIEEGELSPETQVIDIKDCGTSRTTDIASEKVTSKSKIDNKRVSSVLSCISNLALDGQQKELNQHSKMALNTSSGAPKTKSCMKVYPLDMEERGEGGVTSERQVIYLKDHATSHPGNLAPAKGTIISKTDSKIDSLVPSSISILASDGLSGPQDEHNQQSKLTRNATPEALKSKSCYPLDTEDNQGLFLGVPNLELEQEMRDAYGELFGDMNPDDFLNYDFEIWMKMNE